MRRWLSALAVLLVLPAAAVAQSGSCEIEPVPGANTIGRRIGDASYVSGRATYRCQGGTVAVADSAVSVFGRLILIGRVVYEDLQKSVSGADRIEYEGRVGTAVATGNVTIVDKTNGSILRAPQGMTYSKAMANSPDARIRIFSGRPRATLLSKDSLGRPDTTIVDSDRMELVGERLFRGWGAVVVDRGELDARGSFVEYDQGNRLVISGNGQIRTTDLNLWGDSIHGTLDRDDQFTEVRAFRNARLEAQKLTVIASRLRIALDSGVVQRLFAVSDKPADGQPSNQAFAAAENFELTADSIDAVAPAQRVETVTAVGRARGLRLADSVDTALPQLIQSDWVAGDTVIAHFIELPDSIIQRNRAAGDTANDRTLDRLIALGAPASSLYRHREQGDTARIPAANYLTARRIIVHMLNGEVSDVNADGDLKGIYIEPVPTRTEPQKGSGQKYQPGNRPNGTNGRGQQDAKNGQRANGGSQRNTSR